MSIRSKIYKTMRGVNIICMHHMGENKDNLCDCVISQENFMSFISDKKFISWQDAVKHPTRNNGSYCITIDDGLKDVYDIYIKCKEKNIPIVVFVSSQLVDSEGYITKAQLLEMAKDNLVTIGSHGQTHAKLTQCDNITAKNEVRQSKIDLELLLKKPVELYAYPNGAFFERDLRLVQKTGYRYAFGTIPRKHSLLTQVLMRYNIPRINLTNETCNKFHQANDCD